MIKNYLLIAFRNIVRNKVYSFINIFGLAVGMVCCFLILLWVQNELSFDKFHEKADRLQILCAEADMGGSLIKLPVSNYPSGPAMKNELPEIENYCRMLDQGELLVNYNNKQFYVANAYFSDSSIFQMMSFHVIKGDPISALARSYTVAISRKTAELIFGDDDPIGQTINIDNQHDFTITAVLEDTPQNSSFEINMLVSMQTLLSESPQYTEDWFSFSLVTLLLLKPGTDITNLPNKLDAFVEQHMGDQLRAVGSSIKYYLMPLTRLHLYSGDMDIEFEGKGSINYIYIFSFIAFIILMIACFNFINISTARSMMRAKEVGLRKTCGAGKSQLISQFLGESIIICLIAVFISILIFELMLPIFNSLTNSQATAEFLTDPIYVISILGLSIVVGIAAGLYPSIYLSSFEPVKVLKSNQSSDKSGITLKKILVIVQFAMSAVIIIGAVTVYSQLEYMKNQKLGFQGEQVLTIQNIDEDIISRLNTLKLKFESVNGVMSVSATNFIPGNSISKSGKIPEGYPDNQPVMMDIVSVDPKFISTMGVKLLEGRNFSDDFATDSTDAILLNETAVKQFGWDEPIGKIIKSISIDGSDVTYEKATVIGVVNDFHTMSLHSKVEPTFIRYQEDDISLLCIRLDSTDIAGTIAGIKDVWNDVTSGRPFDYKFLDESFDRLYQREERLGRLVSYFGIIAILIGCLGLFGLSIHTVERRTKEIGIRKVLGASSVTIITLLSKEFLWPIIWANLIAWPIGYILMSRWLEEFAYRIDIGPGAFISAGLFALLIAMATVSFQAIKAARSNPVNSIKSE